ncbi:hypothetical protein Veis_3733 [Verminephrobacter eiseniae EF01-2]|uniref:Uncharacterized protein n=2 Tax=Verminephrobacter eiseniae TaxID=364317 RepID=A1WP91_VEREI|nr:hypothetical protein Veis_3733 [Verminephrobacter eiseniae EF01-2]MCW5284972.1 hypothetical protein [Verminephrobacter eiseniae]MCW8188991.1 hypothetical protein [Verminephrobacter eiseniae]
MQTPPTQTLDVCDSSIEDAIAEACVELKNEHRMNALRTRMRAHVDVTFQASPVARVMRRDWNIVSSKLYVNALAQDYRQRIESDMIEMTWQMDDTADQVRAMPFEKLDTSWLHPRRMQVQVVHPITAAWLRSMVAMDEMYAKLICAEKAGMITLRKRHALLLPCQLSYMAFKATAMKMQLRCTDELLIQANL